MRRFGLRATIAATLALVAFTPSGGGAPVAQAAPARWALLIGISDYINFEDVEGGDLHAGASDARSIRDALVMKMGVPESNIRLLVDHAATRAAIEESITVWLADNVEPDDEVSIYFAGHGSQMWDESGDEDDGLDETLAPADVLANSTENDISDDTFNEWLAAIPTRNVVVYLDNCSSGTGTRDVTPFSRGRLLARDLDALERPATAARRALSGQADDTGFDGESASVRVLELSAAQPNQVAVETYFPGTDGAEAFYGGAFTTFLVRQLWKAPTDATYADVFDATYEALKRNRFQQDPYISEDVEMKDRSPFLLEAMGSSVGLSLPVTSATRSEATLGAGIALGITRGSVFETESGARLVATSVGQRATRVSVSTGSVAEGDQAKLVAHRYEGSPLQVSVAGIDSRLANALRTELADADDIELIDQEDAFAHLIVRRGGDLLRVVGTDGFPRHTEIPAEVSGMTRLASLLRKEAAAKSLGDMDNPAQSFDVRLSIADGQTSFGVGEEITFSVESERDGYLTLVDLGTDGTVAMLLPNAELSTIRLRAGQRFVYPDPDGTLEFQALEPAGTGLVRAFVTAEPIGVPVPAGEAYAFGGEAFAKSLVRALQSAVGELDGAVRLDSWGTASIVYDIHD